MKASLYLSNKKKVQLSFLKKEGKRERPQHFPLSLLPWQRQLRAQCLFKGFADILPTGRLRFYAPQFCGVNFTWRSPLVDLFGCSAVCLGRCKSLVVEDISTYHALPQTAMCNGSVMERNVFRIKFLT